MSRTRGAVFKSRCMTSQTTSVSWKALGKTGTSSGVLRAMASAATDADAGAERCKLGCVAVAAKAEILARERFADRPAAEDNRTDCVRRRPHDLLI